MFKQVSKTANPRLLRRIHTGTHTSTPGGSRTRRAVIGGSILLASAALGSKQLSDGGFTIYNDAAADITVEEKKTPKEMEIPAVEDGDGKLRLVVWGSNRYASALDALKVIIVL